MQLRHMSASVERGTIVVEDAQTGELCKVNGYILTSYNSIVAAYDTHRGHVYFLPRYDYSRTTTKHVHAFMQDYCSVGTDVPYDELRRLCKANVRGEGMYHFANGWVTNVGNFFTY